MESTSLKPAIIILVVLTLAFAGYYFFIQNKGTDNGLFADNKYITAEMLQNAQEFMDLSNTLDTVTLDTTVFDDPRFISYRNFTLPVQEQNVGGRDNPFTTPRSSAGN